MDNADEHEPHYPMAVRKWDVIDALRRRHSLTSIVQILTPSTGADMHGRPELARFSACTVLMYEAARQRQVNGGTRLLPTLHELETWCVGNPLRPDLVFIDCWHDYDDSMRVLQLAQSMLPRGGFIVMHDCDPPAAELAGPAPESLIGSWCGESWRAFVDVAASLPDGCEWFVVESDYGVGVIGLQPPRRMARLLRFWRPRPATPTKLAPEGYDAGWKWLVEHRAEALRPVSIADWQQRVSDGGELFDHYNS